MNEDEEFFAWLDGELEGEAAERVAARVAASPELTGRAEQHRKMAADLRQAFQPVADTATEPPSFRSSDVIDFGARATEREGRRSWLAVPQWAAVAASLAIGLVVGTQINGERHVDAPVAVEDGQMIAAAALDDALDTRLASAPAAEGSRIGLTFRDAAGRICRSFTDRAVSGLACREAEQWRIRGLFPAAEGQSDPYRMAAGDDPRLSALIDEAIAGEPFDAEQEKAALDKGWR